MIFFPTKTLIQDFSSIFKPDRYNKQRTGIKLSSSVSISWLSLFFHLLVLTPCHAGLDLDKPEFSRRVISDPCHDIFSDSKDPNSDLKIFHREQGEREQQLVPGSEKAVYKENHDLFQLYVPRSQEQATVIKNRRGNKIVAPKDPHHYQKVAFLRSFHEGNFNRENSFFVSYQSRIIGRIIKKTDYNKALVEIINSLGDLEILEVFIYVYSRVFEGDFYFDVDMAVDNWHWYIFAESIYQGNPQLEDVFAAFKSSRKSIDSSELKIPSQTHEEQKLKNQGYSPGYIRGLDEVNEWLAVRKQLIELKVNPHETHVDYFADKMKKQIEYIRKAIINEDPPNGPLLLKMLESLENQANLIIQETNFTYIQWLKISRALTTLLTTDTSSFNEEFIDEEEEETDRLDFYSDIFSGDWMDEYNLSLKNALYFFPADIFIPTALGKLGIIALNKASSQGVQALGLSTTIQSVDGEEMDPHEFLIHDITHAEDWANLNNIYSGKTHRKFYEELTTRIQNLSMKQRKNIEFAYFILTHEKVGDWQFVESSPEEIKKHLIDEIRENWINRGLAQELGLISENLTEQPQQTEKIAKDFTEIFSQIKASGIGLKERSSYTLKTSPNSYEKGFELP